MKSIDSVEKKIAEAITTYSGSKYTTINSELRRKSVSKTTQKVVDLLDLAMITSSSKMVVHRAASVPAVVDAMKNNKNLIGLTFTDDAFVSTTKNKTLLRQFESGHMQGDNTTHLYVIHVPAGTNYVDMSEYSQFGNAEEEILLERGLKFKITEVEDVKEKEKYRIPMGGGKMGNRTVKRQYIHIKIV
jgi:hypothetical protein